ncbi:MAG: DUF2799 domain-containing protein [Bacteriovoracaceae bacterium]|nr:DUF2799 domain-containing protein [Bacteriovoracaceae bacterium]
MRKFAILSLSLLLLGCSHWDKNNCKKTDWGIIGYEDSLQGRPANEYEVYVRACEAYKVKIDVEDYKEQHTAGLKKFCTYDMGLRWGREKKEYLKTCTPDLEYGFMLGYERGLKEEL